MCPIYKLLVMGLGLFSKPCNLRLKAVIKQYIIIFYYNLLLSIVTRQRWPYSGSSSESETNPKKASPNLAESVWMQEWKEKSYLVK